VLLASAVTACDAGGDGGGAGVASGAQALGWKSCPAGGGASGGVPAALPDGTEWECAAVKVPVDWSDPGGQRMNLALIRARAKDPGRRIGSLVFNFGGPGASSVAMLPQAAPRYYMKLHARYDLVGFDPRGTGASRPVRCLDDTAREAASTADSTPDDKAEAKKFLKHTHQMARACQKRSGGVLAHVDTTSTARDMDLLRRALGEDKLHYFGISYGTQLGAVYAHLFPHNIGRAVFDAVTDPAQTPKQTALGQAKGFQHALDNFLKDCAHDAACPAGTDPRQGLKKITSLLHRLDEQPLPTADGRKLTQSHALDGLAQALYAEDYWPYLQQGLKEAQQGSGTTLLALSDTLNGRDPQGHYSGAQAAYTAITCADTPQRYTPEDVKTALPAFRTASPVFGDYLAWTILQCTSWPAKGGADGPDVSVKGSAPIVLIGTTGDPATPYTNTQRMAQQLGKDTAIQITNHGKGHSAYGTSQCVTDTINNYLLHGALPKNGTRCTY
jgi:pimeloyl-ACP methyl ester carboxylesterase